MPRAQLSHAVFCRVFPSHFQRNYFFLKKQIVLTGIRLRPFRRLVSLPYPAIFIATGKQTAILRVYLVLPATRNATKIYNFQKTKRSTNNNPKSAVFHRVDTDTFQSIPHISTKASSKNIGIVAEWLRRCTRKIGLMHWDFPRRFESCWCRYIFGFFIYLFRCHSCLWAIWHEQASWTINCWEYTSKWGGSPHTIGATSIHCLLNEIDELHTIA